MSGSLKERLNVVRERFAPFHKSLKPWSQTQIDQFAKVDPVNAKRIKSMQQAGFISYAGGCVGFVAAATVFFKRAGTINGGLVSALIGGIPSFCGALLLTQQATVFTHELYKFDALETNGAFYKWWAANGGAA